MRFDGWDRPLFSYEEKLRGRGAEGGWLVESEVFGVAMAEDCRREMSAETSEMKLSSRYGTSV